MQKQISPVVMGGVIAVLVLIVGIVIYRYAGQTPPPKINANADKAASDNMRRGAMMGGSMGGRPGSYGGGR